MERILCGGAGEHALSLYERQLNDLRYIKRIIQTSGRIILAWFILAIVQVRCAEQRWQLRTQ